MFAEFEDDDDYDEVDEDQQEQAPTAPAVPVVASVDPASVMTTNTQQGGTAPVPVGPPGGLVAPPRLGGKGSIPQQTRLFLI